MVSQESGGKMNPEVSNAPAPLPLGVKWKQTGFSLPKARESYRFCLLLALKCSRDWPPWAHFAYESSSLSSLKKLPPQNQLLGVRSPNFLSFTWALLFPVP